MQQTTCENEEPNLSDLLSDPVLQAILKYDKITVEDVKKVVRNYQTNLTSSTKV